MSNETNELEGHSNWIEAHFDPVAAIYTFSSCLGLMDLNGDGDNKLVIGTLGSRVFSMKLKVFKGTSLLQENSLSELPAGLCIFYMDLLEPRIPGIAIASGPSIYVYKNMRPYYKFTLPQLPVNAMEGDIWNQAREDKIDFETLRATLSSIKENLSSLPLTTQSLQFLQLVTLADQAEFVAKHRSAPLKRQTVITCISTIKKSVPEDDGISFVIVATETKELLILDSESFSIQQKNHLPDVAYAINASGLFDVDFRIFVACRTGRVYIFKKGSDVPCQLIELQSQIVGMERVHKHLVIACMDNTLSSYTSKGKRLWMNYLPANVVCTAIMDHKGKGFKAIMVALDNSEVHVFRDQYHVDTLKLRDPVRALLFGKYGREDCTLVAVLKSGAMDFLVMKRIAHYAYRDSHRGPPAAQSIKLTIPKKTQLFVDQTLQEREHGTELFQAFQQNLQKFQLTAAKTYLKALYFSIAPISADPDVSLKISADVHGLGPVFKLVVTLQNTASDYFSTNATLATGLKVCFKYSDMMYRLEPQLLNVPALVPGVPYKFETRVESIVTGCPSQGEIYAVVVKNDSRPVVTANIAMPVSEAMDVV